MTLRRHQGPEAALPGAWDGSPAITDQVVLLSLSCVCRCQSLWPPVLVECVLFAPVAWISPHVLGVFCSLSYSL